jgi:hypothetical protein
MGKVGVAIQETDHGLDDEVVGSGTPVLALLAGPSERGANPIHEHDFRSLGHDASTFACSALLQRLRAARYALRTPGDVQPRQAQKRVRIL